MRKNHLFWIAILLLTGCGKITYYKTAGGMPYEYFPGNDTLKAKPGDFIKVNLVYRIRDSVLYSTYGKPPIYIPVEEQQRPYDVSEVFTRLHQSDSVVCTQFMDTFIKRDPMRIPPQFKKGDRILTTIKVLRVFTSQKDKEDDEDKVKEDWLKKEEADMENYLSQHNIKARKSPSGVYIQTLQEGTGNQIDSGKYVTINYIGHKFDGTVFDNNTFSFTTHAGQMIKGFDEGVSMLKLHEHATVFIPSMLGYADKPPPGSSLRPYDSMIFDITVTNVQDKAPQQPLVQMPELKTDSTKTKKK